MAPPPFPTANPKILPLHITRTARYRDTVTVDLDSGICASQTLNVELCYVGR